MDGWRCGRTYCRGTLLNAGDGERCLLCGRGPIDAGEGPDWDLHLASISALMRQPPGSAVSLRSSISDEMYERHARGMKRKWLPWAGYDGATPLPRGYRGGGKAAKMRELYYEDGLSQREIIAEGRRRLDEGLPGWKADHVRAVLSRQRQREKAESEERRYGGDESSESVLSLPTLADL